MKELRRKRLNELLASPRFRGDREKFCQDADITNGRLSQLLDPDEPFGDVAAKNLVKKLDLQDDYFTTITGTVTARQDDATTTHAESTLSPILAWEHEDDLPQGEYVFIPRLDIHLSAGNGREQVEFEFVKKQPQAFRADWIRLEKLNPSKLACMKVDGDSMESLLFHGETVVIDISQNTVRDGKVYAIWYDGGERVKRLWKLPGGGLRIKSDNANHPTIEVLPEHADSVRILGRVVHKSGTGGL